MNNVSTLLDEPGSEYSYNAEPSYEPYEASFSDPLPPTGTSPPLQPPSVYEPLVFHVPRNTIQIIDFSRNSRTPESKAKHRLLSNDPNNNVVALLGVGGAGKTTIMHALGWNEDIWAKFRDGVWFFELAQDTTVEELLDQLKVFVERAFPDFCQKFIQLAAKEKTHREIRTMLVNRLKRRDFLLLFDDVCDLDSSVYRLVNDICIAIRSMDEAHCKVLMSTRHENNECVPNYDVSIAVNPNHLRVDTCLMILCCYANIDYSAIPEFSPLNKEAIERIIQTSAKLPLALSVAGCVIQNVLETCLSMNDQNGIVPYWESLNSSITLRSDTENDEKHEGLYGALQSTLQLLEKRWKQKSIALRDMFQSFCILRKQITFPLWVAEKLWGVSAGTALDGVNMLSQCNIVSLVRIEDGPNEGVRIHNLVHDFCVEMAGSAGARLWHAKLVDAYRLSLDASRNTEGTDSNGAGGWWNLPKREKYMRENLVRHLLGARRVHEVLRLLTDYRWVEEINEDQERPPFQKIIAELQLLQAHLEKHEKTETGRRLISDIDTIVNTMGLCMIPYCMKNRKECTFQLYGRLQGIKGECGLVARLVSSIERHGRRPWARAGRGLLKSGLSLFKRVLELDRSAWRISVGTGEYDVAVGGFGGHLQVLNSRIRSMRRSLNGHRLLKIVDLFVDRSSGLAYSCDELGCVTIWKEHERLRSLHAQGVENIGSITCMQVLPKLQKAVLGTYTGRLFLLDISSESTSQAIHVHSSFVSSLSAGQEEYVLVSTSADGKIDLRDTKHFMDLRGPYYSLNCMVQRRSRWVQSAVLSNDGRLLAIGSEDNVIRIWNVQTRQELWISPRETPGSNVMCVLFSRDTQLLFSGDRCGKICVWRVRSGGRNVSLVHTLRHETMQVISSLHFGEDSELFALSSRRVSVWNMSAEAFNDDVEELLPQVQNFAISADELTIATFAYFPDRIELRRMDDVVRRTDHIISSFSKEVEHYKNIPIKLAVSNNQQFVALSRPESCDVDLFDTCNGRLLRTLPGSRDLDWFLHIEDSVDTSSSSLYERYETPLGIVSLRFSSDSRSIFAIKLIAQVGRARPKKKRLHWDGASGELLETISLENDGDGLDNTQSPRLSCEGIVVNCKHRAPRNITYEHGGTSFTIATLGHDVQCSQFCSSTSRLWLVRESRGLEYVDLITHDTQFPHRRDPALPVLSQPDQPPSGDTATEVGRSSEVEGV